MKDNYYYKSTFAKSFHWCKYIDSIIIEGEKYQFTTNDPLKQQELMPEDIDINIETRLQANKD